MAEVIDTTDKTLPKLDAIAKQARDRYDIGYSFEEQNRKDGLDDLTMLAGDHWPKSIRDERETEDRPVLTVNKLPSFVDKVRNDSKLNDIRIQVVPYSGGATKEIATTMQGLIRNIENESNAGIAYQTAEDGAINNGFGYFRIVTEYADDESFDQVIRIKRIRNPFTVILDPYHTEYDSRDKDWAIVSEMVDREVFKAKYGRDPMPFKNAAEDLTTHWVQEKRVRIAEYWVKEPVERTLLLLSDGRTVYEDEWSKVFDDLKAQEKVVHLEPDPNNPQQPIVVDGPAPEGTDYPEEILNKAPREVRRRKVKTHKIMQYLVDAVGVIGEPTEWAGKYIPIIPVWGKELNIGERRMLRSLIRFAKDPQRMYNYFRTAATETVALAPKAPYIAEERQVKGYEEMWADSNRKNLGVLLYKHISGVAAPSRQVVTQTAIGEITESNISNDEMKATTSLFDPSLGQASNEVSGTAIQRRQFQSDVANFDFYYNLKVAVQFAGDILVDLIPRIYDTERQVAITGEDDEDTFVTVNQVVRDEATGEDVTLVDLTLGNYKTTITDGPNFATQRQEAVNSMMDFVRTAPAVASLVMDLIAENMNWKGSTKFANRLKRLLEIQYPGIDSDQPMQPPKSLDDAVKELKAQSIQLGNEKKKLDVIEKKQEMEGTPQKIAEAGARGAINTLLGGGEQ